MKALQELIARHKAGRAVGIYSVCSAHPLVIEAALRQAVADGQYALIEATSNQVNQFGGYSGMKPEAFRAYVDAIRARTALPPERLLLGGDHLGPNCWRAETAASRHGPLGAADRRLRHGGLPQDPPGLLHGLRR